MVSRARPVNRHIWGPSKRSRSWGTKGITCSIVSSGKDMETVCVSFWDFPLFPRPKSIHGRIALIHFPSFSIIFPRAKSILPHEPSDRSFTWRLCLKISALPFWMPLAPWEIAPSSAPAADSGGLRVERWAKNSEDTWACLKMAVCPHSYGPLTGKMMINQWMEWGYSIFRQIQWYNMSTSIINNNFTATRLEWWLVGVIIPACY